MTTSLPRPICRSFFVCIAALVCLGGAACFRSMDPTKIRCVDKSRCPTNYSCIMDNGTSGHCQAGTVTTDSGSAELPRASGGAAGSTPIDAPRSDGPEGQGGGGSAGSRDGAQPDMSGGAGSGGSQSDVGGTAGVGGNVSDTPTGTGGSTSQPDVPMDTTGPANGSTCTSDGQCSSSHCIDGVCCATTCTGCNACSNALTGDVDGKCTPVASGKLAHQACSDETMTKPCGNDGTCDGKGACRKAASGKQCGDATCKTDTNTYVPAPTCDGTGTCAPGTPQACSPYQCSITGGCNKKCTKQTDCDPGTYCDTTAGTCAPTKPNGTAATQPSECTHGIVADGVCCDKECTGCSACTATLNGQAASTTGTCLPVTTAKGAAPHGACTIGADSCGMDGTCDGNGNCHYPAVGSDCGTPSCNLTTSMLTKSTCSSSHTCTPGTATACAGSMTCLATGTGCKTGACSSSSDCVSGTYCVSGTCGKKAQGDTCGATAECSNGLYCADGVCCNTICQEECKSCNLPASKGTCTRLSSGQPVHASACASDGSTCGGSCNSSKDTCSFPASGQSCGTGASCSSNLATLNASTCNGSGSCSAANQNCSSLGQYCDSSMTSCAAKKSSGSCTLPIQCSSNCCSGSACVSLGTNSNCSACGDVCGTGKTCQSGTCACGSSYTTCGSSCCGSSQTCYNGSCCTPSSQCGALQCGQASNSCGGLVNCGSNSGGCPSGQTCNAGSCQNTCQGGVYVCSSCLAWNFESGTTQGWSAKSTNCTVGIAAGTGQGSYSLSVSSNDTDGSTIEVTVPLCGNGASIAIPSAGYTFSAQVKFQSFTAFGDDGQGGGSAAILIEGEGYYNPVYTGGPIGTNQWITLPGGITQITPTNASHLTLRFFPYSAWNGVIYIDNISIN